MLVTMLVKRTVCRSCGAPKVTRPKTGWVYCDYCGVLTDWDVEAAKIPAGDLPPAYMELAERLAPQIKAALAAGDRARYHALQYELLDGSAVFYPQAYPPRAREPEYRARFVRYTAATCTVQEFDAGHLTAAEAVNATALKLSWDMSGGTMRLRGDSFWPMWKAFVARVDCDMELNERSGLLARHPDAVPRALLRVFGLSAFAQTWLQYLGEPETARLLAESGLGADYVDVPPPNLERRHCGGCGVDLDVAPGAKRVVCEACGHLLDVFAREVPCTQCGRPLSWPAGKASIACPGCRSELRAVSAS
jgi:uncharacterized Zn finger protein (UPF0148 family)